MSESGDAPPVVNLAGKRIALGPMYRELIPALYRWLNDIDMQRMQGGRSPSSVEQATAWYESQASNERDAFFVIYELPGKRPIGITGLKKVERWSRTADFVIFIGEPDARGKGYGTEATTLMLDYAFTAFGLHNVMLTVYEFNVAGLRAYTKAGFRECGRRRQSCWMGGRLWDELFMDCLASEFESPVLRRQFALAEPKNA